MEKRYLVERKEIYEDPMFDMETSDRYEALCRIGKIFSKLSDGESAVLSEFIDGVPQEDNTLRFFKMDGIKIIHDEIEKEKNSNLVFIVTESQQYESASKKKILVTTDKEKAFNVAKEAMLKDDPYHEEMVGIQIVKNIENLDGINIAVSNKQGLSNFAYKYGVELDDPEPVKKVKQKI